MQDGRGHMYDRAIAASIPDGIARRFDDDLRSFKSSWRAAVAEENFKAAGD